MTQSSISVVDKDSYEEWTFLKGKSADRNLSVPSVEREYGQQMAQDV